MSKHRSDLTDTHSAFDFDVVTDAPRPFKVQRGMPADAPAAAPPEAAGGTPAGSSTPSAPEAADKRLSPLSGGKFDFGNP